MGELQSVNLPSRKFTTKTEANEFFKNMLNQYNDGEEINSSDSTLLQEVLLFHPQYKRKKGIGVKKFFKQKSLDHPTSCFHLERDDGSTTDFSYMSCISKVAPTLKNYFYRACRQSITKTLTEKKNQLFAKEDVYCCKTNKLVYEENSEYRHTTPKFNEIVEQFKKGLTTPINNTMFSPDKALQYSIRFSDKNIETDFIKFHQEIANLDIFKK
ncbi:MAG: DCL family protein [Candidatus Heimdallarchaeaceae archaeon]